MAIDNLFNGGPKDLGPKTPEKDKDGNKSVEQSDEAHTSGDSQPQDGSDIVNEQEQNDVVNGQDGTAAEEFVNSASSNTRAANENPLNKGNGAADSKEPELAGNTQGEQGQVMITA